MSNLLLRGGRLVDPANGVDTVGDVLVVDGAIEQAGSRIDAGDAETIECDGMIVAPGFVDMHVHLREPGFEYKETIATGTMAAAAGGFTAVACMPNTKPVNDHRSVTEFIIERARFEGHVRVCPIGAVSIEQAGEALTEIGELVDAGCVAISDDGYPVATAQLMRKALEYTRMFDIPVIEHCEELSMTVGSVVHEGAVATALGMRGWPAAAEEIIVARDLLLAEATGGRLHLAHLSTAGSMRLVRDAKERGVDVTCEVMTHHFSLTDDAVRGFDTNTKMNPPLRAESDRQALIEAIGDGTVDVIATDHAPHHRDEKLLEYDHAPFGIVGLETAVPLTCTHLLRTDVIDAPRLVELMSVNPSRILGLEGGALTAGTPAHLTVIDPEHRATVDASAFHSKSQNTPFDGETLYGWPTLTVVNGTIAWQKT
ncbi:MAG TPA: dihydroorotase [Acidobacteriota bacterium]|nr:dihydroorotase [Acidobacteriota bacterium]